MHCVTKLVVESTVAVSTVLGPEVVGGTVVLVVVVREVVVGGTVALVIFTVGVVALVTVVGEEAVGGGTVALVTVALGEVVVSDVAIPSPLIYNAICLFCHPSSVILGKPSAHGMRTFLPTACLLYAYLVPVTRRTHKVRMPWAKPGST